MIIEGLLATHNIEENRAHVAPMGPVVDEQLQEWTLRPFQTSTTFRLLRKHPVCVFHVVDDVLPVVQTALGYPADLNTRQPQPGVWVVDDACHWFQLEIIDWKLWDERSEAKAVVTDQAQERPFWGWNRAKHAILEATILATRLHLANIDSINDHLAILKTAIDKTAGPRELEAWELVSNHIQRSRG